MVINNIKALKRAFLSGNFDVREPALKKLVRIKDGSVVNFFIRNLVNKDRRIQTSAAIGLRMIADNKAIKPLLKAIKNPHNKDKNREFTGSFVYALQTHNCENLLIPLVEIALFSKYESQVHALEILSRQKFNTSQKAILDAREMVRKYLDLEDKSEDYKVLVDELSKYLDRIEKRLNKNRRVKKI